MSNVSYVQSIVLHILLFFTQKIIIIIFLKKIIITDEETMALLNTIYLKKVRDGTINIAVNDFKSKGNNGRAANKQC